MFVSWARQLGHGRRLCDRRGALERQLQDLAHGVELRSRPLQQFLGRLLDRFGRPGQDVVQRSTIKSQSVDTNNPGRDNHLASPDFFNAKQYAAISFKSSSVKPVEGGYEVTGDLTLHGETKPVTFTLKGGKVINDPRMGTRTGFSADFVINRTDFGVGKNMQMLGEDVHVSIGFEGTKKK